MSWLGLLTKCTFSRVFFFLSQGRVQGCHSPHERSVVIRVVVVVVVVVVLTMGIFSIKIILSTLMSLAVAQSGIFLGYVLG